MDTHKIRQFRRTLRKLERLIELQQRFCCSGATLAQCHVLLEVEELGQATTGQLADSLGLDKSTLSRTVDGLVNLGLLKRLSNPQDRRTIPLLLTDQGKTICNAINTSSNAFYAQIIERIPQNLRQQVIESFDRFLSAFNEQDRYSGLNEACKPSISAKKEKPKHEY